MSKHTPWEIEWGNPIAIGGGISFVPQSLDGTHTATAYLISQAPAMLEALELAHKTLLAICERMTVGDRWTNEGQDLLDSLDPIRAAIKAAKGEA